MNDGEAAGPQHLDSGFLFAAYLCPHVWEDACVTVWPGPAERGRNLEAEQGHQQWVSNSWAKLP